MKNTELQVSIMVTYKMPYTTCFYNNHIYNLLYISVILIVDNILYSAFFVVLKAIIIINLEKIYTSNRGTVQILL